MQSFALTAADKQLIKTFLITFIAVVAGLPVAAAIMPGRENALAHPVSGVTKSVADAVEADACGTGKGTGAKSTKSTHEVVETRRSVTQTGNNNQNGTNNSQNNGGATAQVGRDGIAASVNALNDLVDVSNVLNGNTVSVPVLSNNTTPILSGSQSGTGNGGLLGLGLLGL